VEQSLVVFWVNPRSFDAPVAARVAEAPEAQAVAQKTFHQCWQALDDIALVVDLQKDLEVSLAVKARADKFPAGVRQFLAEMGKPSELWERFPDDALFAVAGRLDSAALIDALGAFLTPADRDALHDGLERTLGAALGQSAVKDVLPCIGPDGGLCITAAPAGDKAWVPHVVAALRVAPGQKTPPVDQALWRTLDSYALLAVLDYNRQHKDQMSLKTAVFDKLEIKYAVNDQLFPPSLQPAYALHGGYLLAGTSPEALRRFATTTPARRPAAAEFPLLRVSLKAVRQLILDRREPLGRVVADKNKISPDDATARLDGLAAGLQLFDYLEVVQRLGEGQTRLTLRLTMGKPLRR
jgi:hypothetical protein